MREGSNSSSKGLPKELPNITFFFFFNNRPNPVSAKIYISAGMTRTDRNSPKFDPRWNVGYSGISLHTGTKNFGRSDRNGTESITMLGRAPELRKKSP